MLTERTKIQHGDVKSECSSRLHVDSGFCISEIQGFVQRDHVLWVYAFRCRVAADQLYAWVSLFQVFPAQWGRVGFSRLGVKKWSILDMRRRCEARGEEDRGLRATARTEVGNDRTLSRGRQ